VTLQAVAGQAVMLEQLDGMETALKCLRKAGLMGGFVRNERFAWATNVLKETKTLSMLQVLWQICWKLAPPRGESNAPFFFFPRSGAGPRGPVIPNPFEPFSHDPSTRVLTGAALPTPPPNHQLAPQPPSC